MNSDKTFKRTNCFGIPYLVGTLLILAFLTVGIRPVSSQNLKPMVFAVSVKSVTFSPLFIAEQAGFFKEEGISPKFPLMASDLAVKALASKDVDFAASGESVAKAAAIGFPVKIVLNFFNGSFFYIVTKPEIKKMEDLRGKTIAISRFGSSSDFDARAALQRFGLDPATDVKIIGVGGGNNRLATLISGRVDASMLEVNEKSEAEKAGMKALLFTGQYTRQPFTGLGTSVQKIVSNREDVKRAVRAVSRALTAMKQDRNLVKEFFEKELKVKPDEFEEVYQTAMRVFTPTGRIELEDLKIPYEDARKGVSNAPQVPMSSLVDFSILDEVQRESR